MSNKTRAEMREGEKIRKNDEENEKDNSSKKEKEHSENSRVLLLNIKAVFVRLREYSIRGLAANDGEKEARETEQRETKQRS
jgi:hypothetical protein